MPAVICIAFLLTSNDVATTVPYDWLCEPMGEDDQSEK